MLELKGRVGRSLTGLVTLAIATIENLVSCYLPNPTITNTEPIANVKLPTDYRGLTTSVCKLPAAPITAPILETPSYPFSSIQAKCNVRLARHSAPPASHPGRPVPQPSSPKPQRPRRSVERPRPLESQGGAREETMVVWLSNHRCVYSASVGAPTLLFQRSAHPLCASVCVCCFPSRLSSTCKMHSCAINLPKDHAATRRTGKER